MELTLSNATRIDNVFYWDIPFDTYKIQSVTVIAEQFSFTAKYNNDVEQYLESGRPDDSCPAILTGRFSVYFFIASYIPPISNVESIKINIVPVSSS